MRYKRFFYLSPLMAMLLTACEPKPTRIKIVCTSDVHGNFFPYDFRQDKPAHHNED